MQNGEQYRVLVLGDFHFGESYTREGGQVVAEHGYRHSTELLKPFADAADAFILNLETPLLDPTHLRSPLKGKKTYIHWGDPQKTLAELQNLGVNAVSLANNHTVDYGVAGLEETFHTLSGTGVDWFGAGRSLAEAQAPYRLTLPERVGGGEFHFHGGYQYTKHSDVVYDFYADDDASGCAPLKSSGIRPARDASTRRDSFQVAFPHWGANYVWRSQGQYRMAHRFLKKEYDLVLGHGGHSLQEVHRKYQRWVVYGLGNGLFNSAGRWHRYVDENRILPVSVWAILEVNLRNGQRFVTLKLYPVYSNNRVTYYRPGPVSDNDFEQVVETLASRPARPWRFNNSAQFTGTDDLGNFIALELGNWPVTERPARLEPETENGDPGDWPLRSPSISIEDRVLALNKGLAPLMLTMPALSHGAKVHWFHRKFALINYSGKRFLAHDYRAHESALGATVVKDKILTAELLRAADVTTPATFLASSAEEAVQAAQRISGPVVLKPRRGNKSRGVSTGLLAEDEIRSAFEFAREYGSQVIVQQHVNASEELRVMASSEDVVAVIRRILPNVVGDGLSTVRQLIADKNQQRELNPSLWRRPIPLDEATNRQLRSSGLSLESVPTLGESVTVRGVAGLSVGADSFQDLAGASDSLKRAASTAIAAIPGMRWGGVDVIVERDTGRPFVIEVNSAAAYGAAMFPSYGKPLDIGSEVWNLRLDATSPDPVNPPQVSRGRTDPIPLIAEVSKHSSDSEVPFSRLYADSLKRLGYSITSNYSRVFQASKPQGPVHWLTNTGMTTSDRDAVYSVMQRHSWIHGMLDIEGIPIPRASIVATAEELELFVKGRVRNVVIAPTTSSWLRLSSQKLSETEALAMVSLSEAMWVQARSRGRRVRVLATKEKALAVTAKNNRDDLDNAHIESASRLAVQAVRAIPELRWSAVDLLVRPTRIAKNLTDGILVEGLTLAPRFSPMDMVISGDFDTFCEAIVESRTTTN